MAPNLSLQERELLNALSKHPKGADTNMLLATFPALTEPELAELMNKLSAKQMVDFVQIGGTLAFRARDLSEVEKMAGFDQNERIVYNIIRGVGNQGIWIKEIKTRSNMHTQVVNQCIKSLEKKNVIKSVKSVKNPTKKLYMLYELDPSTEITGGAWYTDQEYDLEFIEALSTQCYKYIYSKSFPIKHKEAIYSEDKIDPPTAPAILKFIKTSGVTNVDLSMEDVKQLLERLMFDGKIYKKLNPKFSSLVEDADYVPTAKKVKLEEMDEDEEVLGIIGDDLEETEDALGENDHAWVYMAMRDTTMKNVWTSIPCGNCAVFDFCADDGPVNPAGCEYYNKWLDF